MSILLKRFPLNNLITFLNRPKVVQLRDRVGSWRPVRFVLNVVDDYASVAKDTVQDARSRPWRTTVYCSLLATACVAHRYNPTKQSFTDIFLDSNNDLIQVSPRGRNPVSQEYLVDVQRLWNQDRLQYHNFGVCSVIVRRDHNQTCDLYEARCKYLKVPLERWYSTVVDVGVLGRWIFMERSMKDYDVNSLD